MVVAISAAAAALLLAAVLVMLIAWRGSRGVYNDYLQPLDEKQFHTKNTWGLGCG